jgi:two-component system nitrate/nitrite response regulator NarL/two-component system nitrate/nitrite response regulator NarP
MILILDDHPVARQGLCAIIRMNKPEEEIFQAGTVREAVGIAEKTGVDMAFIDINLGKESGFDFMAWLKRNQEDAKTFFITSSSREGDFIHAKKMGVDAYLLKDAFIDEIVCGLKVVERGGKFYSSALIDRMNRETEEEKQLKELTEREMDVLTLMSQGCSNGKISEKLFISAGTTKKHVSNILGKLGFENRMEAMLFANKNGLIAHRAREAFRAEEIREERRI